MELVSPASEPTISHTTAQDRNTKVTKAVDWSASVVAGRLVTGWLMDHFFAPRVALAFLVPSIVGVAMLAGGAHGGSAFVAAMMIGLASGAEVDVIAYLTGRYFGNRHYSKIYGTFFSAYALGSGYGPAITAWLACRMRRGGPLWPGRHAPG